MKKALEFIGAILVIQGLAGIVHELTGWFDLWTIVHRIGFLSGYEIFANIVLAAVGAGIVALGNSGSRVPSRT